MMVPTLPDQVTETLFHSRPPPILTPRFSSQTLLQPLQLRQLNIQAHLALPSLLSRLNIHIVDCDSRDSLTTTAPPCANGGANPSSTYQAVRPPLTDTLLAPPATPASARLRSRRREILLCTHREHLISATHTPSVQGRGRAHI